MNVRHDPELDEILQDQELRHIGGLLSAASRPEPPLDEAFRSSLRRQLMQQAWDMSEGRHTWWKRAFAPPGLAWAGASAGIVLIASIVVFYATQPPGSFNEVVVNSPIDGSNAVALQQPILVAFNQPMDHTSTQAAVQIAPATNVTFSWSANNLYVQPATGTLAPNTQYQVTIGPTAKTASGQPLTAAQTKTITFVTQPPPTPAPSPSPTPKASLSPGSLLTGEHTLAPLGGGASTASVQWSADSSTVYFVSAGALKLVPAKGGDVTVLAPDGVSSIAMAPAGDRLAYVRNGKIEVLTFAAGTTSELVVAPAAVIVGWANDKLVWATPGGFFTEGASAPTPLAPLPSAGAVTAVSISPDGSHAVYTQDKNLFVLDLTTAKSTQLGQTGAAFEGWSPSGAQLLYGGGDSTLIVDVQGGSFGSVAAGDASWSAQDAILLGSDTELYEVHPDGSNPTKLTNGTYHGPVWAPNAGAFTFFRGGAIWTATAPALPPLPSALDQAAAVVNSFMQARQNGQADQAATYLDANGKLAYATGGLNLIVGGDDPRFSRYYILTQELTSTQPDVATFTVRLVLTHGKLDLNELEESLTLVRDPTSHKFVVDQAAAGARRDLGKGAEVVAVDVAADTIKVTFDSDLAPATVQGGVLVLDAKGNQVAGQAAYAGRVVAITGLDLKPGGQYKLVVLTTVRDVSGQNVASEYDLTVFGPAVKKNADHKGAGGVTVSPEPSPSPRPSPSPTPSPTAAS
jgi:hypothetical protein